MKNVSTFSQSPTDSPKTPGGISRSLLTPCRRVGLSRNFRKSGASPFQSPLSANNEVKQVETKKRKDSLEEIQTPDNDVCVGSTVNQTPTRKIELPSRKKSKTILPLNKNEEIELPTSTEVPAVYKGTDETLCQEPGAFEQNINMMVSTPVHTKSLNTKTKSKKKICLEKEIIISTDKKNVNNCTKIDLHNDNLKDTYSEKTKEKSPNNLTKECIVVIQKKIFKKEFQEHSKAQTSKNTKDSKQETVSQALFDSDTDDIPLICLNKTVTNKSVAPNKLDEDNFSVDNVIQKPDNTKQCKTMATKLQKSAANKSTSKVNVSVEIHNPLISQSSCDDDDDFFEKKRTILVRKNYDKVMKPQKAKSTGSITQKDIDNLKARIETKKKMLLARAMTEDTKELRDLIKKWQKGCQDALMELLDLMKSKFPDKHYMDYSEMLETLKIPASLVGYDSDNDCFLTPDDNSIILANVKE